MSAPRGARAGRPLVAVDLVPIHQGEGGSGGGIWSHAVHLLRALDRLAPDDLDVVVLAHPGQRLAFDHLRVETVPVDTRATARRLRWIHADLPRWCRRHGAALLHKLATEVPAALAGTRLVTTVHDFMPQFFREQLPGWSGRRLGSPAHAAYFEAVTRRCFARSDAVVVISEAVAAEARRRFPHAAGRLAVVHNGVDHPAEPSPPRPEPGVPFRFLYVGTLSPYKGQLNAARGLARLAAAHPDVAARVRLTFRGFVADPAYLAAVRAAVGEGGIGARVDFAAYEPAAGPADIYAAGDALVLLSEYEGFGLPPLEAQVAGLPALCADLPVFREVLGDGALFVPQRDPALVADAMRRLATDAALRASLVACGRANAPRFSWARAARETLAVYRRVLAP